MRILNNKTRKDTETRAEDTHEYGGKNNDRKEMLGLQRHISNMKVREGLNIFHPSGKIIKSRKRWEYHTQRMEDKLIPKKILTSTTKME
jgi:hypothetical protein